MTAAQLHTRKMQLRTAQACFRLRAKGYMNAVRPCAKRPWMRQTALVYLALALNARQHARAIGRILAQPAYRAS